MRTHNIARASLRRAPWPSGPPSLEHEELHYPVSELAARYGASVDEETSDFEQVYPRFEPSRREHPSYWDQLPWT
jgi:hypothetical protein